MDERGKEDMREHRLTQDADENGNTSIRNLGLLVARGTLLTSISPVDGSAEIENPFLEEEGGGGAEDGGVVMDGP